MDNIKKDMNYAVVIGDWHFNSLGVVRSLGENGVDVFFLNYSKFGYAENSRYTKKVYYIENDVQAVDLLLKIAEENVGNGVIFPCSDEAALMLDRNLSKLESRFIVPNAGGKMEHFMQKDNMCSAAEKAGFIVPESTVINLEDTYSVDFNSFPYPAIAKPLASLDGQKADIKVCPDSDSLKTALEDLKSAGYCRILIQQFLFSDDEMMVEYCGCKVKGEPVYLCGQLEKIREYPPDRGSTSFARIVPDIKYIDKNKLDSFLESAGFEGLFDLEIKVTDNTAWFIEINFRNGAPAYAFSAAGFNAAFTWYCRKTGLDAPPITVSPLKLMSERDDLNHVKDKNISLAKWLADVRKTNVFMIFNRKDRQPFRLAYNRVIEMLMSIVGGKSK